MGDAFTPQDMEIMGTLETWKETKMLKKAEKTKKKIRTVQDPQSCPVW